MASPNTAPGTPLPFAGVENFRELGGYQTADGRRVRHGLFYRSGALCEITLPQDQQLFDSLGIQVVCDFRSSQEREVNPDPRFDKIVYHGLSAMWDKNGNELNFDPRSMTTMTAEQLMETTSTVSSKYESMPMDNPAYKILFNEIADGHFPILFHCSAGKDRTGVAAALILKMLGVPRETIVWDYMHTNDCRPRATRYLEGVYREKYKDYPQLEALTGVLTGVRQNLIETSLNAVDAAYPSMEAYLQDQYGIGPRLLAEIRSACLE